MEHYRLKKSGINHPLLKIIFSITLALVVHFREFFPFGVAELLFLIPLCWILLKINSVKKFNLLYISLGLFICSVFLLSYIMLGNLGGGGRYFAILLLNFIYFWLIISIKYFDTLSALKWFIIISAIVSALTILAFFLFYLGNHSLHGLLYTRGNYARAHGFLNNPNYYSISMLFAFFAAFSVWYKKRWGGIYVLIILLGVLFSLSRGAILALAVFFLIVGIHNKNVRHKFLWGITSLATLAGISLYGQRDINLSNFWITLTNRFSDSGGGAEYRFNNMNESLSIFSEGNYLIGIGRTNPENVGGVELIPHNTFITFLIDVGVIGMAGFLLLLAVILLKTVSVYNRTIVPLAIFMALITIAMTNDYHFVKEWWFGMSLIYVISKSN